MGRKNHEKYGTVSFFWLKPHLDTWWVLNEYQALRSKTQTQASLFVGSKVWVLCHCLKTHSFLAQFYVKMRV